MSFILCAPVFSPTRPPKPLSLSQIEEGARSWYFKKLKELKAGFPDDVRAQGWDTSPFIYAEDGEAKSFIGGCDRRIPFQRLLKSKPVSCQRMLVNEPKDCAFKSETCRARLLASRTAMVPVILFPCFLFLRRNSIRIPTF